MEKLSFVQRVFKMFMPASNFENMCTESQQWKMFCKCGYSDSVWGFRGIRYEPTGEKRTIKGASSTDWRLSSESDS